MIRSTLILRVVLALASCAQSAAVHGDEPAKPAPTPAPSAAPPDAAAAGLAEAATAKPDAPSAEDDTVPDSKLDPLPESIKQDLEQQLKSLEDAGLSDADKQKAVKYLQQALESFNVANQQLAAARNYEEQIKAIGPETAEYESRLAKPLPPLESIEDLTLAEVEERAAKAEASVQHCKEQLANAEAEPKRRSIRLAALPKEIADFQEKGKQAANALAEFGNEDVKDAISLARRAALTRDRERIQATVKALEREQRLYKQGGECLKIKRDYYARYVPHKDKRFVQLREEINQRRVQAAKHEADNAAKQAAEQVRRDAEAGAVKRPKVLTKLAEQNESLAKQRAEVVAKNTRVQEEALAANQRLDDLKKRRQNVQVQVEISELADFNGELLRKEQADLPKLYELRRRGVDRRSERIDVLMKISDFNDQRSALANLDDLMERLAAKVEKPDPAIREQVRKLLAAKSGYLDDLITDFDAYSNNLNELDSVESQLVALTEEYSAFIAQRVLWIRSAAAVGPADLAPATEALAWSLDPENWTAIGAAFVSKAARNPLQSTFAAAAVLALIVAQTPVRRRLKLYGEEAAKRGCTKLHPTFHALWLTVVLALPWPALLACLAVALADPLNEVEFVRALGAALGVAAMCLLLLELLRHLCRRGGLADAHFEWPSACLAQTRSKARWLTLLALPMIVWLAGLEAQSGNPQWSASLGRTCFIGVMLLLATLLERLLLARGNPFRQLILYGEHGWLVPLQIAWRPAVVALPAALAILAAVGYYYTAQQAAMRLVQTASLILAVLVLGGFTRRWLLVNRRRLAREQAKQRRAQLAAAAEADPTAPPPPEMADDVPDLAALSEQTQKLVQTFLAVTTAVGIVLIWAAILPALAYLGQAQINPAALAKDGYDPLTWGKLFKLLAVLAVTFVSVRDIPALLELAVLQHLPLDGGFRYAFTTMCRYVLAAIGITVSFSCIGWHWNDVQWLVAAMSVGLGFGLQEIFANFVSGIILLFERPIRVGDLVTLGETTGVVNRIRMRATTIVDHDRKEFIVPNKDLVTERLLNWTLTDHTNRIVIFVGVAYGSDTDRACALLLESAREQPHVLKDPPPVAFFDNFGDSSLNLKLMCFLPNLENRWQTIHAINSTIDRKFKAAGLEIPFPQRDLHVRMVPDAASAAIAAQAAASHLPFGGAASTAPAATQAEKRHGAA